jgi:ubiquinone/menaquinone biosynthesis C-methylase UbiE
MSTHKNYFRKEANLSRSKDLMVDIYSRFPLLSSQTRAFVQNTHNGAIRILDAGCGEGGFLKTAARLRPNALLYGVDLLDHLGVVKNELDVDFKLVNLVSEKIPYPDDYFDYINCSHVLEHLNTTIPTVSEFARVLKPGGVIYIETPDIRWTMLPRIPFLISDVGGYHFWDDPTHVRPFSRVSLRLLVGYADLTCMKTGMARKWAHLGVLPQAIFSRRNDYKTAVLQALLGLWCYVIARKEQ